MLERARGANASASVADVWTAVLSLPTGETVVLFHRLGQLIELAGEVRTAIREQPDLSGALYLRWEQPVDAVLRYRNLDAQWAAVQPHLKPEVMQALEFCDHALRERIPEKTLGTEDVKSLREDARKLLDDVRDTELVPELKMYLAEQMWNFLEALDTYDIGGIEPLRLAFAQAVGGAVLLSDSARTAPGGEEVKERMGSWLKRVAVILSIGSGVMEITRSALEIAQTPGAHH